MDRPNILEFSPARRRSVFMRSSGTVTIVAALVVMSMIAVIPLANLNPPDRAAKAPMQAAPANALMRAKFQICGSGKRHTCVADGDTVWFKGEKMRLRGFNTPEVSNPKCRKEARLAAKATKRLQKILNANAWSISRHGFDRYGRTLAEFHIGRETAGDKMIREGLAHKWEGYKHDWC